MRTDNPVQNCVHPYNLVKTFAVIIQCFVSCDSGPCYHVGLWFPRVLENLLQLEACTHLITTDARGRVTPYLNLYGDVGLVWDTFLLHLCYGKVRFSLAKQADL